MDMSEDSRDSDAPGRSFVGRPSPLDVLGRTRDSGPDWWSRLWEGSQRWGSCEDSYLRHGIRRVRFTVYPPGASAADRRRIRVWHGWTMWSAAAWLLGSVLLQSYGVSAVVALVVPIVAAAAAALVCRRYVGLLRHQVKTVVVLTMAGCTQQTVVDRRDEVVAMATTMIVADRAMKGGVIDAVEHELVWQRIYDEIGSLQCALAK